jgi:hypothetical protein
MPIPSSLRRRTVLAVALAAPLAAAAPTGAAIQPTAGSSPSAAYVTVKGNEAAIGDTVTLPAAKAFASNLEHPVLHHASTGSYGIRIPKLGDTSAGGVAAGVVHARAVGAHGSCSSDDLEDVNGAGNTKALLIGVECVDDLGNEADLPFTVEYTRGGTQSGELVTARVGPEVAPEPGVAILLPDAESSVGGPQVEVIHSVPGDYRFELPTLPGAGAKSLTVSPMAGFHGRARGGATCSIEDTALIAGGEAIRVHVVCRTPGDAPGPDGESADPGVAITYAKDVNPLGISSTLSTAYLTMPKTTAPVTVLDASHAHDEIFGQTSGKVTVLRQNTGTYRVDLPKQQNGHRPETAIVTAQGGNAACSADASVTIAGTDAQSMRVTCRTIAGQPVDTAFRLDYTVHE